LSIHSWHPVVSSTLEVLPEFQRFEGGTMKPMLHSERPIKPSTVDRLHKAAHDAVSKAPKSIDSGQFKELNKLGTKKG
jgi:hypothetical protein